jgi:hypothetical protein
LRLVVSSLSVDSSSMEGLENLCSRITLTGGEKEGISISEGEISDVRQKGELCLVGKLWTEKPTNKEAFKTVLSRLWRTVETVIFKEIQENLWLFEFSDAVDKCRVLAGRPWAFDRQALIINEFDGQTPPSQMVFTSTPIWIQVHDMPLLCMSKTVGIKIGASMGKLEDVDLAGDGAGWGRCLRLRVNIDLSEPLERGRALQLGGHSYWVIFKYEKLPMFCFYCGRVIHGRVGCPQRQDTRINVAEDKKQWGTWLRAEGRNQNIKHEVGGRFSRSRVAEDDNSDDGGGADRPFFPGDLSLSVTGRTGRPSRENASEDGSEAGSGCSGCSGGAIGRREKVYGVRDPKVSVWHVPDTGERGRKVGATVHAPTAYVVTPDTIGMSMTGNLHDVAKSRGKECALARRTTTPPARSERLADIRGSTKDPNCHDKVLGTCCCYSWVH